MKFRKRPIVIEAERFYPAVEPWPEGVWHHKDGWRIHTPEGAHAVTPGDWIITGIRGEKYPCNPDIFEETYEGVEE